MPFEEYPIFGAPHIPRKRPCDCGPFQCCNSCSPISRKEIKIEENINT